MLVAALGSLGPSASGFAAASRWLLAGDPPAVAQATLDASHNAFDVAAADALLWRAGRFAVPAVPAARSVEREAARAAALATLRRELEAEGPQAAAWSDHLALRLEGTHATDELWCAAARVAGELARYDLAPKLSFELSAGRAPRRRVAAQDALHRLYGRWFVSPEEVQPYLDTVGPGPGTQRFLAALDEAEERSRLRLLDVLRARPEAAPLVLADPDPRVRAEVAELLGKAMATQSLDPELALPALLARLNEEAEPRAYHAVLQAALVPLERAPLDSPRLAELRGTLARALDEPGLERSLSVTRALARLPWRLEEGAETDGLCWGIERVGRALALAADPDAGLVCADSDAVVGTLEALRTLCDRARDTPLADELRRCQARESVFQILQDPRCGEAARTAAVAALGPFALPEDGELLVAVLARDDATPALSHALLGALRPILLEFDPQSPGTDELLLRVVELSGAADADLRRRALGLLCDDALQPLVCRLDPAFLVLRLEQEVLPDLTRQLLHLLARFGRAEMLPELLELERFDELTAGEAELVVGLGVALESLSAGRAEYLLAAGERLVDAPGDGTRLVRLRRALRMAASLDGAALDGLDARQHGLICLWAWELHKAGLSLEEELGPRFLARLVEKHLPGSIETDAVTSGEAVRQHLLAFALANCRELEAAPHEIEHAYARAIALAAQAPDPEFGRLVLRDRGRYLAERGDGVRALEDFCQLFDQDALDNSDLRTAARLLAGIGGEGETRRRVSAPQTCDYLLRLVRRESWRNEPAALRLQDLRTLAQSSIEAGDPQLQGEVLALLDGLPEAVPDGDAALATPPDADQTVAWIGLAREPERLHELRSLAAAVRLALSSAVPAPSGG